MWGGRTASSGTRLAVGALCAVGLFFFGCSRAMEFGSYEFLSSRDLSVDATKAHDFVIVKGRLTASPIEAIRETRARVRLINYEQAFALNSRESRYARTHGYLAQTCSGSEIHPVTIPHVTLLNVEDPAAVAWRASVISSETNRFRMDGSYLDTLRAFFPESFYDGVPCAVTEEMWLRASITLVEEVKRQTDKLVIENGAGLQSGRNYLEHRAAADQLIGAGDGVQIEHFGRSRRHSDDVSFARTLAAKQKIVLAKCDGSPTDCATALDDASVTRAYLTLR